MLKVVDSIGNFSGEHEVCNSVKQMFEMFTSNVGAVGSTYLGLEAGSLKIQLGLWFPRLLCLQEVPDLEYEGWQPWAPHTACGSKPAGNGGPRLGFKMLNPGNGVSVETCMSSSVLLHCLDFVFPLLVLLQVFRT